MRLRNCVVGTNKLRKTLVKIESGNHALLALASLLSTIVLSYHATSCSFLTRFVLYRVRVRVLFSETLMLSNFFCLVTFY